MRQKKIIERILAAALVGIMMAGAAFPAEAHADSTEESAFEIASEDEDSGDGFVSDKENEDPDEDNNKEPVGYTIRFGFYDKDPSVRVNIPEDGARIHIYKNDTEIPGTVTYSDGTFAFTADTDDEKPDTGTMYTWNAVVRGQSVSGNFYFSADAILDRMIQLPAYFIDTQGKDESLWKTLVPENKDNVYTDGGKVYIKAGTETAFTVDSDMYNKVTFTSGGSQNKVLADMEDGEIRPSFFMSNNDTRTDSDPEALEAQDNIVPEGVLYSDGKAPDIAVYDEKGNLLPDGTLYVHSAKKVTVKAHDDLSGIGSLQYKILTAADGDDVEKKIQKEADTDSWKDVPENGTVSVPDTDPEDGRRYVLAVKAADRVGNVSVIATGGVQADLQAPAVMINGIEDEKYYGSDVPYTITASDNTGIQKVSVSVLKSGQEAEGSADTRTDSFSLEGNALLSFENGGKIEIPASVLAQGCTDNNTEILVTATDLAGNTSKDNTYVKILTSSPAVSVSYDDNSPSNGKYFSHPRTMTLVFNDRSFAPDKAYLEIEEDGSRTTRSMKDIAEGKSGSVKLAGVPKDSQAGREESSLTDKRTVTYTIRFDPGDDNACEYTVNAWITNAAGKTSAGTDWGSSEAAQNFVVDRETPEISMKFMQGGNVFAAPENGTTYKTGSVSVSLSVEESYFAGSDISITVKQQDADGREISAYPQKNIERAEDVSNWKTIGSSAGFSMDGFTEDANYSISAVITDPAGNRADCGTYNFTVDNQAPEGELFIYASQESDHSQGLFSRFAYGLFDNKAMSASWSAKDLTSGVKSVSYYIYRPGTSSSVFNGISENALETVPWKDAPDKIYIGTDTAAAVYLRLEDNAGNISYISSTRGIIAENKAASIEIRTDEDKNIYNSDVPFTVTVHDNPGESASGIKSVIYSVSSGGRLTQSGQFDGFTKEKRALSFTGRGLVSSAYNNSNSVWITVTATDYAGNSISASKKIAIDITAPSISVAWTGGKAKNGSYYNDSRTATVTVTERNFDPSLIEISTDVSDGGEKPSVSAWKSSGTYGTDSAAHTCTVAFSKDGRYVLAVQASDKAGNKAKKYKSGSFVVDKSVPVISVTYDNNHAENTKYYNRARTATIHIKDRNLDRKSAAAAVNAALQKGKAKQPSLTGWKKTDDGYSATIAFLDDGKYSFTFTASDLAGNSAKEYKSGEFIIDQTAPAVTISGIKDGGAYRGTVSPVITCKDDNYVMQSASVTLSGRFHPEKALKGVYSESGRVETFTSNDIDHTKENDDVYTLRAVAKDLAGNVTRVTAAFSVNRFGSNYTIDDKTQAYITRQYNNKPRDIILYETNVDPLSEHTVLVSVDGEVRALKEGEDYSIEEIDDKLTWHRYKYTIFAKNFDVSGTYEIKISSKDTAGNNQDNTTRDEGVSFILDKDAPSISAEDIKDGAAYEGTQHKAAVTVTDNYKAKYVSSYVNGKKMESFGPKDIEKGNGTVSFTIKAADGPQEVIFEAEDAAGNAAQSPAYHIVVTADSTRLFWARYGRWIIMTAVIASIILAGTGIIFWKRKRKEKKEA